MQLTRKGFFGALVAAPVAAAAVVNVSTDYGMPQGMIEAPWREFTHRYREYVIYWTGWKPSYQSATMAGQWIAYLKKEVEARAVYDGWYASCPGAATWFGTGFYFNICLYEDCPEQRVCWDPHLSTAENLEQARWKTAERLIKLLDSPNLYAGRPF